jgi:hypothetical protein
VKYLASFDAEAANNAKETQSAETSEAKTPDEKTKLPSIKHLAPDEVKQEIAKYNAIWQGWMYQLPEFRIKNIGKKKADLLKKNDDNKPIH